MTPEQVQEALKPQLPNVSIVAMIEDGRYGLIVGAVAGQNAHPDHIHAEFQRVTAALVAAGLRSDGTLVEHLIAVPAG